MDKREEAQKAYNKAMALAREAYDKAITPAWEVYNKARVIAREAYDKTLTREVYNKTKEEKEDNERTNTSVSNP